MQLTCQRRDATPGQNKKPQNQVDGKTVTVVVADARAALPRVKYVFPVQAAHCLVDFSMYFNEMEISRGV
jgi:hypothetical protein